MRGRLAKMLGEDEGGRVGLEICNGHVYCKNSLGFQEMKTCRMFQRHECMVYVKLM